MRYLVLGVLLGATIGCDSTPPAQAPGVLVTKKLGAVENVMNVEERWELLSYPGQSLILRVKWTNEREPAPDKQPFGSVEVSLEVNEVQASMVKCSSDEPDRGILPNGERQWRLMLSCDYRHPKGEGSDHIATLWASGLFQHR